METDRIEHLIQFMALYLHQAGMIVLIYLVASAFLTYLIMLINPLILIFFSKYISCILLTSKTKI
jgi:hypothetical protein